MRVCLFGGYSENDTRTNIIKKGLIRNEVEIFECKTRVKYKVWLRYPLLLRKYTKYFKKNDFFFVPAFRHKDIPLAKFLSFITKKPLIFDPLVSRYETLVLDWKKFSENTLLAKWNFNLDKIAFKMADLILCDTHAHLKYYHEKFKIPEKKLKWIPVGVDEDIFYPREKKKKKNHFIVKFYGSYLPLHGIEYIVKSAKIIQEKNENIKFELIGTGRTLPQIKNLIDELKVKNINLKAKWVNINEIPDLIAEADICLGIFSHEEKANRVVPNKVFQTLAMKKPLITADTEAIKELFEHRKHLFLCKPGDAFSLAKAILKLKEDERLRKKIAEGGYKIIKEKFTTYLIGKKLKTILQETIK